MSLTSYRAAPPRDKPLRALGREPTDDGASAFRHLAPGLADPKFLGMRQAAGAI